ncbi:hypothetical protein LAT59_00005 [Candidatus Gracilibacteria bacterium]|nr:hypothetical protein [Candidatus Gracilibacteria bacterium]
MKKLFILAIVLFLVCIGNTYANGGENFTSDYSGGTITIEAGESKSISFANELSSIEFSKSSDVSVKTLEAGVWRDVSASISEYKPLRGFIISNHAGESLEITYAYKANIDSLSALIQRSLSPGWNLIGIARNNNALGIESIDDGLGFGLDYSQLVDFTSSNFANSNSSKLLSNNFSIKSKGASGYLQEGRAYAIFSSNATTFGGTQNLTDDSGNIIYSTAGMNNNDICEMLDICPEEVMVSSLDNALLSYNVGDIGKNFGGISLQTSGEKDILLQSITFRNEGTGDVSDSLSNIGLYNNGEKVSTDVELNGRDIVFELNFQIEKGDTQNFEIFADVTGAQTIPETYEFRLRYASDISMKEVGTPFLVPISLADTPLSLGQYVVQGGLLVLSRDTSFPINQTVSSSTSDVVLWAGILNVNKAVDFEDISIDLEATLGANINQISSLSFKVGNQTVASVIPSAGTGTIVIPLSTQFVVSSNTTVRLVANLNSDATGNFNVSAVILGSTYKRYISNDEIAQIDGSVDGISTFVGDSSLVVTRNDGIDNNSLVPGAQDITLLGFQLRANDISDIRIIGIQPQITGDVNLSDVTNIRLYQGSTLLATRNDFNFDSLNVTIPKDSALSFILVADFNDTIDPGQNIQLALSGSDITARNISNNQLVSLTSSVISENFIFNSGAELEVLFNSETQARSIIVPSNTESSVFRFNIEASNDNSRVTDIYVTQGIAGLNLAQALRSASLTLGGTTVSGIVISDSVLHFPFSSQGVLIETDGINQADMRVAFFDGSYRKNIPFRFDITTDNPVGYV